ncbi:MAG: helix-turn-helix domain-containing protein [Chloroflexota bacterium]
MRLDELIAKWTALGVAFRTGDARVEGAALCDQFARDLQQVNLTADDELVTVAEAAKVSGYSAQHLRRLVSKGQLAAERDERGIVIRRRALPKRPSLVAPEPPRLHVVGAKAEQVVRASAGVSRESP